MKITIISQPLAVLAILFFPVVFLYGQTRPGIECGCTSYGDYVEPASKGILVQQGATIHEGSSSKGKYTIEVQDADYPNVANISIYYQGIMIFNEVNRAWGWGFSPDEDKFAMHGLDQFGNHWCSHVNLDPDPSREGEWTESELIVPPTNISSASIRFSPNGKYLLYAGISGTTGGMILWIFDTNTGDEVYDGSTGSIVGLPDENKGVAGWGFSPDKKDATFVHSYLTDIDKYTLIVKNLKAPEDEFVEYAVNIAGEARWLFSPCGDKFAWIIDSPIEGLFCRLYSTNSEEVYETVNAETWWKFFSDEDGHYIKYKDGSYDQITDNTADKVCDDKTKPVWTNAVLDTGIVEGVQMGIHWSGASDASGVSAYRIYVDGDLYKEIENATRCMVTGLTPLATYTFKVMAGDEAGNWSTDNPELTFTTFNDEEPEWPDVTLTSEILSETRIKLQWEDAVDDYRIKSYRIMTDTIVRGVVGKDTLKYTVKGLIADSTYIFTIDAVDEAEHYVAGPIVTQKMPAPYPAEWPDDSVLRATDKTETSFILRWTEAYDYYNAVKHYEVSMDGNIIDSTRFYERELLVKDLEEGTYYLFRVIAIDESGNRSDPLEATLATIPAFIIDSLAFGPGNQKQPDIDDNIVVWCDDLNDEGDIWAYDLLTQTKTRITDNPALQHEPAVCNGKIVWTDRRNGNYDIYMYDMNNPAQGEVPVCTQAGDQINPAIHGNKIVWRDNRNGNFDIYMLDLEIMTESPVCTRSSIQMAPDIAWDYVVYGDNRNGNWDIFLYNLYADKEIAICTDPAEQAVPKISGKNSSLCVITYMDNRAGENDNIYFYYPHDYIAEYYEYLLPLDQNWTNTIQAYPHFEDGLLVYQDKPGTVWSIYGFQYDGYRPGWSTYKVFEISDPSTADQKNPRTSKEHVVWEYEENGDCDVYIRRRPTAADLDLPAVSDLILSMQEITDPVKVGDTLKYIFKVTNNGPDNNDTIITKVTMPIQAKFISAEADKGIVTITGRDIKWDIDKLMYDDSAFLEIKMLTYEIALLEISAETKGEYFDLDPSSNKIQDTTTVKYVVPVNVGEGGMPGMVVESDGKIHLAYFNNDELIYAVKERDESKWKYRRLGYCANSHDIVMAMAHDRKLHFIYSDFFYDYWGYQYHLSFFHHGILTPSGEWTSKIIGATYTGVHSLSLDISDSGELYLAWQEAKGFASPGPFMFRKTVNGAWQEPQLVEKEGYDHIDLDVDHLNNVHFSYIGRINGGMSYEKWTDDMPGPAEEIEPDWKGSQLEAMVTSIVTDENNVPHISYPGQVNNDGRENIKHAWKQDGIWYNEKADDGFFNSAGNQIALDTAGNVNLGYAHYPSHQIRFSSKINSQWIRQIVSDEITGYLTGPTRLGWELDLAMDQDNYGHMTYAGVKYAMIPPLIYFNFSPDLLDFGAVPTDSSKTLVVKLLNPSDEDIKIDIVKIDDPRFSFTGPPYILSRFGEDSIEVKFTQDDQGTEVNNRLQILYNVPSGLMIDIPVKARAWQPRLVVDPVSIDFGSVPLNNTMDKTLTMKNEGPVDLTITEIYRSGIPPGSFIQCDFTIVSNNCVTLAEGQTCQVQLRFKPTKTGPQSKPLLINSNDPKAPMTIVGMQGKTPAPQISVSTYSMDFGYCAPGDSLSDSLYITNVGDVLLNITGISLNGSDANQFKYNGSCSSIVPGDNCIIYVNISPSTEGDFTATLDITSNSQTGSTSNIYLTGNSTIKELTLSTISINFGEVNISDRKYVSLEMINTGNYPVMLEYPEPPGGSNGCEFGHQYMFEYWDPIAPGDTVIDQISFRPLYSGDKTATIKIISNDNDQPVQTVTLFGKSGQIMPLEASINSDPRLGYEPLSVQFNPTVTGGQSPYSYFWDFDDMKTSQEESPLHNFQTAGKYNVTLRIIDITGVAVTSNIDIAVSAEGAPVVIITAHPKKGEIPLNVQFTADTTGGTAPLSFFWEFGDGATSDQQNPSHTYTTPGTYTARVTVTDANSETGADTEEITVIWNNSITGELWNETAETFINRAIVILYPQDNPEDTVSLNLNGTYTYSFPGLESGNYTVLTIPDSVAFPGELPTYLGDELTKFNAEWAGVSGHITGKDIHLISKPADQSGTGSISGEMVEGTKKGLTIIERTVNTEADPVSGAYVYLEGSDDGKLKDWDITASDGTFSFYNLENGSYLFIADYQGKPMDDGNVPLVLSESIKDIEILAIVGMDEITVQEAGTGVDEEVISGPYIYPVPASDHIIVLIPENCFNDNSVEIKILDLSGRYVFINKTFKISANTVTINISNLPDGVYIMKLADKYNLYDLKVIKMKQ